MSIAKVSGTLGGGVLVYLVVAGFSAAGGPRDVASTIASPVGRAEAQPASGSRLKAHAIAATDGAKEFLQIRDPWGPGLVVPPLGAPAPQGAGLLQLWYDSQRKEDCVFGTAADGQLRCLPLGTVFYFYKDANCTQGVVVGPYNQQAMGCPQPPAPAYAIYFDAPAPGPQCPATYTDWPRHVFAVGNQIKGQLPTQYYAWNGPACQPTGGTVVPWLWDVGPEIDPTSFAKGSLATEP